MRIGEIGVIGEGELVGLALAGMLSSLAFAAWADTSAKEATEATKKANDAIGVNFIGILINGMVRSVLPI
jgi:hypothetical protein